MKDVEFAIVVLIFVLSIGQIIDIWQTIKLKEAINNVGIECSRL